MNAKQRKFADNYLKGMSASEAAIKSGYSKKTSPNTTTRMLKNAEVAAYIAEKQAKTSEKVEWTREESARLLAGIARLDHDAIIDRLTEQPKAVHKIDKATRLALDCIESSETVSESNDGSSNFMRRVVKIKPCSRIEAIKELNKMCGFYAPEQHNHSFDLASLVREAVGSKRG